jgi:hypothetical protein
MKAFVVFLVLVAIAVGVYYMCQSSEKIEVVVIEYSVELNGARITERDFIAKDRVRAETEAPDGSSVEIVRLDKDEVWIVHKDKKTCDVLEIEPILKASDRLGRRTLDRCRVDPNWAGQIHALESYLSGSYEMWASPKTVSRQGYECREIRVQLGSILRLRELIATDDRIPDTRGRAGDAIAAAVAGALSPGSRHLGRKRRAFGNLCVVQEGWFDFRGLAPKFHLVRKLDSIRVKKVNKSLFEIPEDYRVKRIRND